MLKSVRLTTAVASAPQASFFSIGCCMHWKEVTVSVTGLLMPLSVSVPSTDETLSPSKLTLLEVKSAVDLTLIL
jgi:hypothetical protein